MSTKPKFPKAPWLKIKYAPPVTIGGKTSLKPIWTRMSNAGALWIPFLCIDIQVRLPYAPEAAFSMGYDAAFRQNMDQIVRLRGEVASQKEMADANRREVSRLSEDNAAAQALASERLHRIEELENTVKLLQAKTATTTLIPATVKHECGPVGLALLEDDPHPAPGWPPLPTKEEMEVFKRVPKGVA